MVEDRVYLATQR